MPYMARVEKVENNPEKRSKNSLLNIFIWENIIFPKNYTTSYYTLILP